MDGLGTAWSVCAEFHKILYMRLLILGSSGPGDNLHQFPSDDRLSGTIEKNLELVDHVTSILRGVLKLYFSPCSFKGTGRRGNLHPWHFDALTARMRDLLQAPVAHLVS